MKTTIKYVLQGKYTGDSSCWNPWQDEAKEERLDRIEAEYKAATNISSMSRREFRIVKRTITEVDEVIS